MFEWGKYIPPEKRGVTPSDTWLLQLYTVLLALPCLLLLLQPLQPHPPRSFHRRPSLATSRAAVSRDPMTPSPSLASRTLSTPSAPLRLWSRNSIPPLHIFRPALAAFSMMSGSTFQIDPKSRCGIFKPPSSWPSCKLFAINPSRIVSSFGAPS